MMETKEDTFNLIMSTVHNQVGKCRSAPFPCAGYSFVHKGLLNESVRPFSFAQKEDVE